MTPGEPLPVQLAWALAVSANMRRDGAPADRDHVVEGLIALPDRPDPELAELSLSRAAMLAREARARVEATGGRWYAPQRVERVLGSASHIARDDFDRPRTIDPVGALICLSTGLLHHERGVLRRAGSNDCAHLLRSVDPDILVTSHAAFTAESDGQPLVQGLYESPVLDPPHGVADAILADGAHECHLHLAGALPPSLYWSLALRAELPIGHVLGDTVDDERWERLFGRARANFCALSALTLEPAGVSPSLLEGATPAELLRRVALLLQPSDAHIDAAAEPFSTWPLCGSIVLRSLLPERLVLANALRRVVAPDPRPDARAEIERAVVRYIGARNAFYAALIPSRGRRGLRNYGRTDRRYHFGWQVIPDAPTARARFERWRMANAVELFVRGAHPHVARLDGLSSEVASPGGSPYMAPLDYEVRVSLADGEQQQSIRGWLHGVHDVLSLWRSLPLRVGLIIHFIKSERARAKRAPSDVLAGVIDDLSRDESVRPFVVGIDAAGNEIDEGPRAFADAFRRAVRHRPARGGGAPERLGVTFHAGEDFRDLVTGLRHVHEAVTLLGMRHGDRLGHGLALAWDPKAFYAARPVVYTQLRDVALDLLWAHCMLDDDWRLAELAVSLLSRRYDIHLDRVELSELRNLMDVHAVGSRGATRDPSGESELARTRESFERLIGGTNAAPEDLRRVAMAIAQGDGAAGARRPAAGASSADPAPEVLDEEELWVRICERAGARGLRGSVSRDPEAPVEVRADAEWLELAEEMARRVRLRVAKAGVAIEVCPTSNLIIGDFAGYEHLPYTRLNGDGLQPPCDPRAGHLPITICTDDPGQFGTSLRSEYESVATGLRARGFTVDQVSGWLRRCNRTARDFSFIPPWAPRGPELRAAIDEVLMGKPLTPDPPPGSRSRPC